ncbi:MAG TPA: type II secretion system protein [Fimbriimonadaceae bacterium]|nr:type II secretion system protein [Fimbriimonadaceae bacterium]
MSSQERPTTKDGRAGVNMRKNGFTLLELLIVVSILAILMAILLPVFVIAKSKARQMSCLANLKQLSGGLIMYQGDWSDQFPGAALAGACPGSLPSSFAPWASGFHRTQEAQWVPCNRVLTDLSNPNSPVHPDWAQKGPAQGVIYPYLKETRVYLSPTETRPEKLLSYSMNGAADFIPAAMVERPSGFVVLIHEQRTLNDGYYWPAGDCPTTSHSGGANFGFYDGRAKWIRANVQTPQYWQCGSAIPRDYYCPKIPFPEAPFMTINGFCTGNPS